MRFLGFAMTVGAAIVMSACGGGDNANADAGATGMGATTAAAPAAQPATTTGAMAPVTGTMHEVKMIGDASGFKFDPAEITIKQGDGIKWVFVNGGPHNVAFDAATIPAAAKPALMANMPEQMGELMGKMLLAEGETYTISFAGVPAGTYDYNCTPHLAMNMRGKITVQ